MLDRLWGCDTFQAAVWLMMERFVDGLALLQC